VTRSRFLVTGSRGFIGSRLVLGLGQSGFDVVAVDRFEGDLAEVDLEPLLDGVDGVFHMAARPGVRPSFDLFPEYLRDNLLVTQRLFETCSAAGIRVVYASSSSVYGNQDRYPIAEGAPLWPISPYAVTKVGVEGLARCYVRRGLDAVGLRYFTVYGPGQRQDMAFSRIIRCAREKRAFTLLGADRIRDFTYVDDAVEASILAMLADNPGPYYNVGTGIETPVARAMEMCAHLAGGVEIEMVGSAEGDVRRTSADTRAAQRDLGFKAQTSLREGLEEQIAADAEEASLSQGQHDARAGGSAGA